MAQAVALSPGSLLGQDVLTTAVTPLMGHINVYNAAVGPLAPTLRQASLGTLGTTCLVAKDPNDDSGNDITITCYPGETFFDRTTTTRTLTDPGSYLVLQLIADTSGVARWVVVGGGIDTPAASAASDENPDEFSVSNPLTDSDLTRFGERLPTGTGYGGYGDGAYGYGQ
jgi:hypothetical protein